MNQHNPYQGYKKKPQYTAPPSVLAIDPTGVRIRVDEALNLIAPLFSKGKWEATATMIASVMRITGLYSEANDDDVGNILIEMEIPSNFRGNKMYFNLSNFESTEAPLKSNLKGKK